MVGEEESSFVDDEKTDAKCKRSSKQRERIRIMPPPRYLLPILEMKLNLRLLYLPRG